MKRPLEWETNYCLSEIEYQLEKTVEIEEKLFQLPGAEITIQEHWRLRETLRSIRHQVEMLREDIKHLEETPEKKTFIKKLMRK